MITACVSQQGYIADVCIHTIIVNWLAQAITGFSTRERHAARRATA